MEYEKTLRKGERRSMDEPVKQLIVVAIVVIVGIALIALAQGNNGIVSSIGNGIRSFIDRILAQ